MRHVERGVEHAFAHREVSALERAELLAVLGDDAIHVVAAARLWHVSELRAHVAQGAAVICHLVHVDRRGHGQLLLRLREVDVAVEHARDVGRVRNDRQYLAYVEPVERSRDVLQCLRVVVVAVYLQSGSVAGRELHVSLYPTVVAKEDIVAVVYLKRLVAQYGLVVEDAQVDATRLHLRHQAQADAQLAAGVVYAGLYPRAMAGDGAVEEGVERQLALLAVVRLEVIGHVALRRRQVQPRGVYGHAVHHYAYRLSEAVDAAGWRRRDIHVDGLEVEAVVVENLRHEVVGARLQCQLQLRQSMAQSLLVNVFVLYLPLQLCHERRHGLEQLLVAARGMEVEMEVVAVGNGASGVAVGVDVKRHVVGAQVPVAVPDGDVGEQSFNLVKLVEIGCHVHLSAHRHGCRLVDDV